MPTALASFSVALVPADPVSVLAVMTPPVWLIAPVVAVSDAAVPEIFPAKVRSPVLAVRLTAVPPPSPLAEKAEALVKLKPVVAVNGPTAPTALASFSVALVPAEPVSVAAVMMPPVWLIAPVVAVSETRRPETLPARVRWPVEAVRLVEVPPAIPLAEKPAALVRLRPVVPMSYCRPRPDW